MSIASMPMYDIPEVSGALDALWAGIARALHREGVADVPGALVHGRRLEDLWDDPDLFLSQCCGFDVVKSYTRSLRPVATPRYGAPGCNGTSYSSIVIVPEDCQASSIEDLFGKICAVNGPHSHSGMNALRALVAPHSRRGQFFSCVRETGAHAESVALVQRGAADVAAIDCVTLGLLARHRPDAVAGTRELCRTNTAPGIPYVTRVDAGEGHAERLQAALASAFDDPDLASARDDLFLTGIEFLPHSVYYALIDTERFAIDHGYPKLR